MLATCWCRASAVWYSATNDRPGYRTRIWWQHDGNTLYSIKKYLCTKADKIGQPNPKSNSIELFTKFCKENVVNPPSDPPPRVCDACPAWPTTPDALSLCLAHAQPPNIFTLLDLRLPHELCHPSPLPCVLLPAVDRACH
jgi:hypothetical protein